MGRLCDGSTSKVARVLHLLVGTPERTTYLGDLYTRFWDGVKSFREFGCRADSDGVSTPALASIATAAFSVSRAV